jgi:hypothetical protein
VIISEAAATTRQFAPEVDPASFQELHAGLLERKDAIIASGVTGRELAEALNALAVETQRELTERVGAEAYQKLMGVDAGETLGIVEPDLAEAAGKPVPPAKG